MDEDDSIGEGPVSHRSPLATVPARVVVAAGAGAYAWWAVSRPAFSASATAAVLAAGVLAVAAGVATRPSRRPVRHRVAGWGAWAVLAVTAAVWQLTAYVQHPRPDHPTLSSLANALLDSHPARAVAFVVWLAGAVHLARR